MRFEEYRDYDAVGLAALIAAKSVSESEVLDAALSRLDAVNPKLNAVINVLADEARAAIRNGLPQGPLRGVPFLIKDLGVMVRGTASGGGSRLLKHSPPAPEDSALVTAYRKAGLVIFGKTNTPEFGMAATTEPAAYGVTRNPWNPDRTCGGSSGGAAVAVAAGILPAAHGSDGGGSIRIPSSCCGLFGLKPSRGRVSAAPLGDAWSGFSINHALTHSVRDSAALLDAACHPVEGDSYWLPPPQTPFLSEVGRAPGKLRIGYMPFNLLGYEIEAPVAAATADAARLCESLGHIVTEAKIDTDFQAATDAANLIVSASASAMFDRIAALRQKPVHPDELESLPWMVYQQGKAASGTDVMAAFATKNDFTLAVGRAFESADVLLLPTLGRVPVPVGELSIAHVTSSEAYGEALYRFINTQAFNISGNPAMSVPLGMSPEGLPIGVQFVGRLGDEATLFRLAAQLEQAAPWAKRRPPEIN
ncbi:MAG: amidase [Alphaproteobacteria bacterium]|nr:amidase [Alphaproteobacteria bacterium]